MIKTGGENVASREVEEVRSGLGLASVDVPPMIHVEDVHRLRAVVDAVAHPILAASSSPLTLERFSERSADPARILRQRPEDELHAGCRRCLG